MSVRAVILPATPLLVPGVAGMADVLDDVRDAVREALAEIVMGGRRPLVVAHGEALRHGRMRPSLAAVGVADTWLRIPDFRGHREVPQRSEDTSGGGGARRSPWEPHLPVAGVGASVALMCLAEVLGEQAGAVETLELPPAWSDQPGISAGGESEARAAAVGHLMAADGLVVAGGGVPGGLLTDPGALAPGVAEALAAVGAEWTPEVRVLPQSHDHLPPEYRVTLLRG
ncbi:hypothetical protein L1785_18595 [Antribacter sp. KLBMP9083]|uniref:Uncharacterized protein n=1 Tax=Antribacter soli TaxID=2910976 RepID=A0AA41QGE6_9MICO|nr:hypothetical protein [Antribacter soli]MCF4122988.1 hypothetical protein [Antribacter soli]